MAARNRRRAYRALALVAALGASSCSDDGAEGPPTTLIPAGDAPAAEVIGPVTGGEQEVPANAMPEGLADENGYSETEYFIEGEARTYDPSGPLGVDGEWDAAPSATAEPYRLRIIVRRPSEPTRFNGTVVVEWLNVSAGRDADPDFALLHPEVFRRGYAYIAVSAQTAGVDGNGLLVPAPDIEARPLTEIDPDRYGSLVHPGDDYSYDVFAQVGATIRRPKGVDPLDGLRPERVIAVGESQSAARLTTFANAVHPVTHVFDGYLIHSRGAGGAPLNTAADVEQPAAMVVRGDLDVPVLQFETETDLFILGFHPSRQPDTDSLRTWEVAGTSHADRSIIDYGIASAERSDPDAAVDVAATCGDINDGPQGPVLRRALDAIDTWIRSGQAPPEGPPLEVDDDAVARDDRGIALGGIRTPAVDAPVATLTGEDTSVDRESCRAFGATVRFDGATLAELYPTHEDYTDSVADAAREAVDAGFLLPVDREQILAAAEAARVP